MHQSLVQNIFKRLCNAIERPLKGVHFADFIFYFTFSKNTIYQIFILAATGSKQNKKNCLLESSYVS